VAASEPAGHAPPAQSKTPWPRRGYAWYVVGVLTIAYTFSFVDRQILSLLVGPVRRDLGISDTQISLLQGLAFALFYTLLGLPIGRLADRTSRRGIIAVGIALWSVMTMVCGLARSFWTLFFARMGVGVGEAALSPAAYSIVADYFPPRDLPKAMSVYSMGIFVGAGLAFILGGAVIELASASEDWVLPLIGPVRPWQMTFFAVGLPGFLVVALMASVREPRRRGRLRATTQDPSEALPFFDILRFLIARRHTYGAHFFGIALMALMGYGAAAWIPEFAVRTYGMTRGEIGLAYGLGILVLSTGGIVSSGWLTGHLVAKGYRDASFRVIIGAALILFVTGSLATLMPTRTGFFLMMVPLLFVSGVSNGIGPAALQLITPNEMRAQVSAVYLFVINIIGLGLGPTVVAVMTDYLFGYDQAVKYSLALLNAGAAPLAAFILWRGLRHLRASDAEAAAWRASD